MSEIDRYLDELFDRLAGQGAAGRRMLEEASDHLRMTAAAKIEAGVPAEAAEREAVAQFGESGHLAGLLSRVHDGRRFGSGATLLAGRALLMLAGCYVAAALALAVWGTSTRIMQHIAAAGGLMLLAGLGVLVGRRLLGWVAPSPVGWLGAALLAFGGVVVFVDLPLAVGLALGEQGLWRHAAALITGLATANALAFGTARLLRPMRAPQPQQI